MEQNQYRMYVDGNTVRKAEALPKDDRQERLRREREAQRARNRKYMDMTFFLMSSGSSDR